MKLIALAEDEAAARIPALDRLLSGSATGGPRWTRAVGLRLERRLPERIHDPMSAAVELPAAGGAVLAWAEEPPPGIAWAKDLASAFGWNLVALVEEHVQLVGPELWEPPAVSRFGFLRRRDSLSRAEFQEHWVGVHGPLVLTRGPRFVRYVANTVLDESLAWDAVVEQQFRDFDSWREHDRQLHEEKPDVVADIASIAARVVQFSATFAAEVNR